MEAGLQLQEWWWCNHIASALVEVHPLGAVKEEGQAGACRATYRKRSEVGCWKKAGSANRCEQLCRGCNGSGELWLDDLGMATVAGFWTYWGTIKHSSGIWQDWADPPKANPATLRAAQLSYFQKRRRPTTLNAKNTKTKEMCMKSWNNKIVIIVRYFILFMTGLNLYLNMN